MRFKIGQKVFLASEECERFYSVETLAEYFGISLAGSTMEIVERWYNDANYHRYGRSIIVEIVNCDKETASYCYAIIPTDPDKNRFTEWVEESKLRGMIKNSPEGMDVICAAR